MLFLTNLLYYFNLFDIHWQRRMCH